MFKAYMNTSHAHIRSDHTETRRHERPGHIENGDNDHLAALARENADARRTRVATSGVVAYDAVSKGPSLVACLA